MSRLDRLAAAGLALVFIVVVASAAIRLGAEPPVLGVLRVTHRIAATAEVFIVGALAWLAWRARRFDAGLALAAVLTVCLSLLGIAAGTQPPPEAALGNILGGLALLACFAWLLARRPVSWVAALIVLQCALGAWFSVFGRGSASELRFGHVLLGTALALGMVFLAPRWRQPAGRGALVLLALALPATGIAAAAFDRALAHATAAALFVALVSFAQPRPA